ncbi:MAG TPA: glycoside hydrolase family 2 TIM barrel-domain containing protein, partial [Bacteroidales bacterium]|nr:glycoside hydrolase family 2 [Bacteroidales bacterium]HRC89881.1 glycoside hydrolase family 2 TIM barrel-domain containing protein [Bacteroidales bacterium]
MKNLFSILILSSLFVFARAQNTEIIYLSGIDKDITVQWDFYCTKGLNSGYWTKIPVPSCWELQGFGTYNYGRDKQLADEQGFYRHEFTLPASARGKRIFIVFEGSMTDTEVKINGKLAGPVHQGSFYRFKYEITKLVKPGSKNLLEVTVSKMSSNQSVNRAERIADYWVFGGIFRPVYLEIVPDEFISHVAIDARADGTFTAELYLNGNKSLKTVEARIQTLEGEDVGEIMMTNFEKGETYKLINGKLNNPLLWSPEFPNLYRVVVSLKQGESVIHRVIQKFGFRTVEVKQNDGIYVNGVKVMFRGVCRHSSWPTSGKTLSKEISLLDVNLMKDMNINAVRMSHYPPDSHFLDVCDSLGLFVIDELAGWQKFYDTNVGKKLVKEMVERDVNHPCIILWSNGNEGGFNPELREEFAKYDPQKRQFIEPWHTINGMNTKHYIPYNYGTSTFFNGRDIFFPTEFLHGLFDGGLGAGLEDYWNLMCSNPLSAGGFLWVFADEGVVRTDKKDSIDTKGNNAPDGILGPFREKEGSYYTIRDVWSPVWIEKKIITPLFDGKLKVENRFFYTSLNSCSFTYYMVKLSDSFYQSESYRVPRRFDAPPIKPGEKGWLDLNLPDNWKDFDIIYLNAFDPFGRLINTWSWNITSPASMAERLIKPAGEKATGKVDGDNLILSSADIAVSFSLKNGLINEVKKGN